MAEQTVVQPEMEPEGRRNTALIAVGVVVVLLLCCCAFGLLLWFTGDPILEALDLALTALPAAA